MVNEKKNSGRKYKNPRMTVNNQIHRQVVQGLTVNKDWYKRKISWKIIL